MFTDSTIKYMPVAVLIIIDSFSIFPVLRHGEEDYEDKAEQKQEQEQQEFYFFNNTDHFKQTFIYIYYRLYKASLGKFICA